MALASAFGGDFGRAADSCGVALFAVIPSRSGPFRYQLTVPWHLPHYSMQVLGPLTITGNAR